MAMQHTCVRAPQLELDFDSRFGLFGRPTAGKCKDFLDKTENDRHVVVSLSSPLLSINTEFCTGDGGETVVAVIGRTNDAEAYLGSPSETAHWEMYQVVFRFFPARWCVAFFSDAWIDWHLCVIYFSDVVMDWNTRRTCEWAFWDHHVNAVCARIQIVNFAKLDLGIWEAKTYKKLGRLRSFCILFSSFDLVSFVQLFSCSKFTLPVSHFFFVFLSTLLLCSNRFL